MIRAVTMTTAKILRPPFLRPISLFLLTVACSAALAEASAPAKKPDLAKGANLANTVCAACHGADGNTIGSGFPKLAGQHPEYLYKQLASFKPKPGATEPERANGIMMGFSMPLSDEDMHNVAAYYAGQKLKPATARNKDTVALGQKIYRGGIAEKNVPACSSCHSPDGAGMPIQYPRVGGQWAEYTEAQLVAFRSGTRKNNSVMATIAARLSDAEMKAVSDYIAGLR